MIVSFVVLLFIAYKISNKSAVEKWSIGFDNENIKVGSDKREEKIFPISQLAKIEILEGLAPLAKNLGINIIFKKIENEITNKSIRIDVGESNFSAQEVKSNYSTFKQFIDNLEKQILQSVFELTGNKDQKLVVVASSPLRMPAKRVYVHK